MKSQGYLDFPWIEQITRVFWDVENVEKELISRETKY